MMSLSGAGMARFGSGGDDVVLTLFAAPSPSYSIASIDLQALAESRDMYDPNLHFPRMFTLRVKTW